MKCIPHCAKCPPACEGLAGTLLSSEPVKERKPRNLRASDRTINLLCGCRGSSLDAELWASFPHPKGRPYWCEKCSKWTARKPDRKPPRGPDEPLY